METSLYLPVKGFLEKAGYVVKGEVGHCDLVGLSDGEPPVVVICELKLSFNLELILQAVDRAAVADEVWIAARVSAKGKGREADKRYRDLCRRLGIGMLGISDRGDVSVIVGSVSPMPRTNPKRRSWLLREHRGVYGWFERLDRGVYGLTDAGRDALQRWSPLDVKATLTAPT